MKHKWGGRSEIRSTALRQRQRSVVVAMIAVGMVQATIDEVVDVIAVRDRLVTAAGSMHVPVAPDFRRAARRIALAHFDDMLVDTSIMWVQEMSVLQVIDVVAMADGDVPAAWAMLVSGAWIVRAGHEALLLHLVTNPISLP